MNKEQKKALAEAIQHLGSSVSCQDPDDKNDYIAYALEALSRIIGND